MSEKLDRLAKCTSQETDLYALKKAGHFAAWLRGVRAVLGLTQEQLARAIGESISTYKTWEYGDVVPKMTIDLKISRLLAEHNRDSHGRMRVAV